MALKRATGTLVRLSSDTLQLETGEDLFVVPRSQITRLGVSRGQKPAIGKGLKFGLLAGRLPGALGGAVFCGATSCLEDTSDDFGTEFLWVPAAAGAVAGMVVGLGIGMLSHIDRWEPASITPTSFLRGL